MGEVGSAVARWRTVSGLRFAAGGQTTLSADLKAWPHVDEGTLVGVTFHVSVNGGAATDVPTTEEVRFPDFTDQDSPLPGVISGMAGVWCCGFDLDLAALAGGTVAVSATVHSTVGATDYDTDVGEVLTFYNDTDGVDRRPCTGVMYVSTTGNDANSGTAGSPKATIAGAINGLVAAHGADLRGGRIVLQSGAHKYGGSYGVSTWHTSGEGWLDLEYQAGATTERELDGSGTTVYPDSYLNCTGNGAGTWCRIRAIAPRTIGNGPVLAIGTDVNARLWLDGGSGGSVHDDGSNLLAAFVDDTSQAVGFDGNVAGGSYIATCHTRGGVADGFVSAAYVHDCKVSRWLGLALYDTDVSTMDACNVFVEEQDYVYEDAESQAQGVIDYAGGANFVVGTQSGGPHDGKMRLTFAGATPFDIGAHAATLIPSLRLGLQFDGFTSAANNGAVAVLDGGTGFVVLDKSTHVPEAGGASARIRTAQRSDGTVWTTLVHPDVWRIQGDRNSIVQMLGVALTVRKTQGLFTAGYDMDGAVFDGITMPPELRNNFDGSVLTNCRLRFLTLAAAFDWGAGATAPNSILHDIVCDTTDSFPVATAKQVDRVHVISGSAVGTNGTTGSWFDNIATGYLPAAGVRGLDSGVAARAPAEKWLGDSAWSQGAGAWPVGELDWEVPATGALAGAGSLSLSSTGTLQGAGALAGSAAISGSSAGTLAGAGALAGSAAVSMTSAGAVAAVGALTGMVTAVFTAAGTLVGDGALAGPASFSLTANGLLEAPGTMTGAASLSLEAGGVLAGDGALAGAGALSVSAVATLAGDGTLAGATTIGIVSDGSLTELPRPPQRQPGGWIANRGQRRQAFRDRRQRWSPRPFGRRR